MNGDIIMEKDYLYLSKEFLQKISNITNWMKENPQITDVNMYEVSECLLEFSFIEKLFNGIREFQDKEMCIEINNNITFLMKYMLDMRSKSITDFIDNMDIADLFDSFVKNSFDGIIKHDNKYKELISKEFGVLFYIYNVRKDNKEYQYDNTAEFETEPTLDGIIIMHIILSKLFLHYFLHIIIILLI